jgi:hypothetical protein
VGGTYSALVNDVPAEAPVNIWVDEDAGSYGSAFYRVYVK